MALASSFPEQGKVKVTSHPSVKDEIVAKGWEYEEERVVVDGKVITSRGLVTYYSACACQGDCVTDLSRIKSWDCTVVGIDDRRIDLWKGEKNGELYLPPSCLVVDCAEMAYVGGRGSDDYVHRIVDDGGLFRITKECKQPKKVNILGSMCCKCPSNPLSQCISIAVWRVRTWKFLWRSQAPQETGSR